MTANLKQRTKQAFKWGFIGNAIKLVLQLGVQAFLARMLGPGEYGLFAVGVIIVSFAMFFADVASSALITEKELSPEIIRFAFTWQLSASLLISLTLSAYTHLLAAAFKLPSASDVILALAWVCFLNAFGGVSLALLRRDLSFKQIQIAQLLGYIVGYVGVAIPWVIFIEKSVVAMVLAWLVQTTVTSALLFYFHPHPIKPLWQHADGLRLIKFGANAILTNWCNWAQTNVDRIFIARYFGAQTVGLYTTAANLMATPLSQINTTFQQIAFSGSAKLKQGGPEIKKLFIKLVMYAFTLVGTAYGSVFLLAEPLVLLIYGPKWLEMVPFIQAFSLAYLFIGVSGVITPLLWGQGAIASDSKVQLLVSISMLLVIMFSLQYSAVFIAYMVALVYFSRMLILLYVGYIIFVKNTHV